MQRMQLLLDPKPISDEKRASGLAYSGLVEKKAAGIKAFRKLVILMRKSEWLANGDGVRFWRKLAQVGAITHQGQVPVK
jgi:hypothetical protein